MNLSKYFNTATNLVYLIGGIVGYLNTDTPLGLLFLFASLMLCLFSGQYHWNIDNGRMLSSRLMDERGMYFVFSTLTLEVFGILNPLFYVAAWFLMYLITPFIDSFITLGVFATMIVGSMLYHGLITQVIVSLLLFGAAFGIRYVGNRQDRYIHDNNWFHGVWHLISGFMITYLFLVNV